MTKQQFNIEVTDTLGGDANYSWVHRYTCKAKSLRGAIQWLALNHGGYWKKDCDLGDMARYNMKNAAICCFITFADSE